MDAWKKCVLSAGKTLPIKFCVLGGGGILGLGGGGKCRFYFYGREDFSEEKTHKRESPKVSESPLDGRTPGRRPGEDALFCQFFLYGKRQEVSGTSAGRPLFVPPGVPVCPKDFI